MQTRRWQDWITLILGIWLFFSPWILRFYGEMPAASWNFFVLGIAFVVFAAFGLNLRSLWEEWVNLILGIWMIISPWVLQYSANTTPRDNAIIVGVIVAVMAIWAMAANNPRIGHTPTDHSLQR
ncbi:MAG: SPW repeat protein [Gammaproteobacteria bacterium]